MFILFLYVVMAAATAGAVIFPGVWAWVCAAATGLTVLTVHHLGYPVWAALITIGVAAVMRSYGTIRDG